MINLLEIGQRLRIQRELHGYTRDELAELIDITPRFYYDLETGLKGMSLATLCKLKEVLHVSTDYLLFGNIPGEGDEELMSLIALVEACPKEKRKYLGGIITSFLQSQRQ